MVIKKIFVMIYAEKNMDVNIFVNKHVLNVNKKQKKNVWKKSNILKKNVDTLLKYFVIKDMMKIYFVHISVKNYWIVGINVKKNVQKIVQQLKIVIAV